MLAKLTVLLGVSTLFASCNAAADDSESQASECYSEIERLLKNLEAASRQARTETPEELEYYPEIEITGLLIGAVRSKIYKYPGYPYADYDADIVTPYLPNQRNHELGYCCANPNYLSWWLNCDKFDDKHDTFVVERERIRTGDDADDYVKMEKLLVQVYDRPDESKWIRWMTESKFEETLKNVAEYVFGKSGKFQRAEGKFQRDEFKFKQCLTFRAVKDELETLNKCWENDISVKELNISGVIGTPWMESVLQTGLEIKLPQDLVEIIGSFCGTKTPLNPLLDPTIHEDRKWIFSLSPDANHYFKKNPWKEIERFLLATGSGTKKIADQLLRK